MAVPPPVEPQLVREMLLRHALENLLDAAWEIANRHGIPCTCDICAALIEGHAVIRTLFPGDSN